MKNKSIKTLTYMLLAFTSLGIIALINDPKLSNSILGGIGAVSFILGGLTFIALLISLVITSIKN